MSDEAILAEPAAISLRGVSHSYGAVRALVDVDLDVRGHEVVAVVGDNGAGKSTLVGVLSGVLVPDAGEVVVDGRETQLTSPGLARGLGIATVFQDLALCEDLDVVENLFLGQEIRRGPMLDEVAMEREAQRLLAQLAVRVPSLRAPVAELSGGQRQAVAIARALLGEPRVLVLDEPTASLGVTQTAEVLTLVERVRDSGFGVVLVSHNLADVQAVADRVVVLRRGRLNGEFDADVASYEQIVAAITGVAPPGEAAR
ncbi:ATP-binding cassette domain-containing protein [Isoptericola sp. b441]|uniref:ATP-binding cassette domain-containing protein n=1 Tax=Actinotalea lenta TaxID=3064654 RepID=A0ABT9D4K1_9CELL|nr:MULTISPECIES: ATP-binding cassette domain-containing protein [unclassified Isoptericola]MDO8105607.1 ATP-binding cassette domain-containing protein [Isoptericola sp. b441]MDO8122727.1 ATP-binding cassette domain-containing protein [Isoptericola sp. b490]